MPSLRSSPLDGQRAEIPRRVPVFGGGNENITSSAVIVFCFTAETFLSYATLSLQMESDACGHPSTPFSRSGACASTMNRGENQVPGTEERMGTGKESGEGTQDGIGNGNENGKGGKGGEESS